MGRKGLAWLTGGVLSATLFLQFCVHIVPRSPDKPTSSAPRDIAGQSSSSAYALAIPVVGIRRNALVDTFTQAREEGVRRHDAIDIVAARGTPVVAAARGMVEKLFESEAGGNTVYIRSPDRRLSYYYAHLDSYAPGLHEGQAIARGDPLGRVGSSGNADPQAPHLHFAISLMQPQDRWFEGRAINPYRLLMRPPVVAPGIASR